MECIICSTKMVYYFSKSFNLYNLNEVEYYVCPNCNFASSKTHYNLNDIEWQKLNFNFHTEHNKRKDNPYNRNQRYFQQALMLHILKKYDLLPNGELLDWGSGEGLLSLNAKDFFDLTIINFDKFVKPICNEINEDEIKNKKFDLVLNTGVFEHVTSRTTLDEINSYVSDTGCLAIHTLVSETIPNNQEWMYLLPVHCSFHTNKSMSILMNQWGYNCSIYNPQSKLWVLFKSNSTITENKVNLLNNRMGWEYVYFKKGFMDFWK